MVEDDQHDRQTKKGDLINDDKMIDDDCTMQNENKVVDVDEEKPLDDQFTVTWWYEWTSNNRYNKIVGTSLTLQNSERSYQLKTLSKLNVKKQMMIGELVAWHM